MIDIKKDIIEHYADLNEENWKLEVNKISWNDGPAKIDIRKWSPDHTKCSKGVSLRNEEASKLLDALKALYK